MNIFIILCVTTLAFPLFAFAGIEINEIAWMGTTVSANDEWIELYNTGSESVDLAGWRIVAADGQPDITIDSNICANTNITAKGYFLLERTDDETVPGTAADCIYTGALGNAGEDLELLTADGANTDVVQALSNGWPAGDNTTKETMQRSGSVWITAVPTPKTANASTPSGNTPASTDTNNQNEDGGGDSFSKTDSPPSGGGNENYVQPENLPHITARAGNDRRAMVGEEVQFRGEAWGLRDEPLENARYLWNLGDGGTKEGKNIGYVYMFPGTYMVRVTVSSGKYTAFDDVSVTVEEGGVIVSEAKPGTDGWIEIENKSGQAVHIGGWIVQTAANQFTIPSGTMMAPRTYAVLSRAVTNLSVRQEGDHVHLFYPNGVYAAGFSYVLQIPSSMSISYHEGEAVFTEPTPGKQNVISAVSLSDTGISTEAVSVPVVTAVSQKAARVNNVADVPSTPLVEETKEENTVVQTETQASVFTTTPPSKNFRESLWFAGSLVAGGLLAVMVVLFRHKKEHGESDL